MAIHLAATAALAGGLGAAFGGSNRRRARRKAVIAADQASQRYENTLAAIEGRSASRVAGWPGFEDVFGTPVSALGLYNPEDPGLLGLEEGVREQALISRQLGVIDPQFMAAMGPRYQAALDVTHPTLAKATGLLEERLTSGIPESLRTSYTQGLRQAQSIRGIKGPSAASREATALQRLQDEFLNQAIAQAMDITQLRAGLAPMPTPSTIWSSTMPYEYEQSAKELDIHRRRREALEWYEMAAMQAIPGMMSGLGAGLGMAMI